MDYSKVLPIIDKVFIDAISVKQYPFGVSGGVGNKIASGRLLNSVQAVQSGDNIQVEMEDYAKYVASGRKPGSYVPLSALMRWTKDKQINFDLDSPAKGFRGTKRQVSLAFAINNKRKRDGKHFIPIDILVDWIKKEGIKGTFDNSKAAAFAISNSIRRFGIRPANIIDLPAEQVLENQEFVGNMEQSAVDEILKNLD